MLHKVPKLLAVTSGLFVVGVLAYTASDRFGSDNLEGQLVTSTSSSADEDVGPLLDPNNNFAPIGEDFWLSNAVGGGVAGGTAGAFTDAATAGTIGGATAGAAPVAGGTCANTSKDLTVDKEICACAKKETAANAKVKAEANKALNKASAAPACAGGDCEQDPSVKPNPRIVNKVGPTLVRTFSDADPNGKKFKAAGCKGPTVKNGKTIPGELVICYQVKGSSTAERVCKKKSSSSSSRSSSTSSRSSSTTTSPSSTSSRSSSTTTSPSSTSSSTPSTTSSSTGTSSSGQ